ncbi:MAG: hypothetical protein ACOCU6_02180, partial [Nanoarchaeota archaeon]
MMAENNTRMIVFFLSLIVFSILFSAVVSADITSLNIIDPPVDRWFSYGDDILFNFSATSDSDAIFFCNMSLDGDLNYTNTSVENDTQTIFHRDIGEGQHTANFVCFDSNFGLANVVDFGVDETSPVVSLDSPSPGDSFNSSPVDFNFIATDNLASTLNCSFYIDGNLNQTNSSVANDTLTTFAVDDFDLGTHTWNITCHDQALNKDSASRSFSYVDIISPDITVFSPVDNFNTSSTSVDINYSVTDDHASSLNCSLFVNGYLNQTNTSVSEGSLFSFSLSDMSSGIYVWNISCEDDYGNIGASSHRNFTVKTSLPSFSSLTPADNHSALSGAVEFNATIDDPHANFHSCDLYVDGDLNDSLTTFSGIASFNVSFSKDDSHDWFINCTDNFGNTNSTTVRSLLIDLGPHNPVIIPFAPTISKNTISLIGMVDSIFEFRPFDIIKAFVEIDDSPEETYNTTVTRRTSYEFNATVNDTLSSNPTRVKLDSPREINTSHHLAFEGHNRSDYSFYGITGVIPQSGNLYSVELSDSPEQDVSVGERVYFFNASKPTGWFNISNLSLFGGDVSITLEGVRDGVKGDSSDISFYNDLDAPVFNTSDLTFVASNGKYLTDLSDPLQFFISDNYNINYSTLLVNFTSPDSAFLFANDESNTPFDDSLVNHSIDCRGMLSQQGNCSLSLSLPDGRYNVTFTVNDSFNQYAFKKVDNFIVKTLVDSVTNFTTLADSYVVTDSNVTLIWDSPFDPFLKDYELSIYDNSDDLVNSFMIPGNVTNYTVHVSDLDYEVMLSPNITVIDELGHRSPPRTGSEFVFLDQTPPVHEYVRIDETGNNEYNTDDVLHLRFNFTDPESGIKEYKYWVGISPADVEGWDNVLSNKTTTSTMVDESVDLDEGQVYYLTVQAKNNARYSGTGSTDSQKISSTPVTVDSIPPQNVSLSYAQGEYSLDTISLDYNLGHDSVSGVDVNASRLQYKKALLSDGVCHSFGDWNTIDTDVHTGGTYSYDFSILDNGCYKFGVKAVDRAGNQKIYEQGLAKNLSVDTTPPSAPSFSSGTFMTSDTEFSYDWKPSQDNQSGISHYEYALFSDDGGPSHQVTDWLQTTDSNASFSFQPHELDNSHMYRVKVRSVNTFGLSSNIVDSPGRLYFDTVVPNPLTTIRVGSDTNGSEDGWIDSTFGIDSTSILLEGEAGLDNCVWKTGSDFDYVDSGHPSCSETGVNTGIYNCTLTNLTERVYDVHVACRDDNNNIQTETQNTDLTFAKEMGPPNITIQSPLDDSIHVASLPLSFDIVDASPVNITISTYNVDAGGSLQELASQRKILSDVLSGHYDFSLNLTNASLHTLINITATDKYGRMSSESVSFMTYTSTPHIRLEDTPDIEQYPDNTMYVNDSFSVNLSAFFFDEVSLRLTDENSSVVSGCEYSESFSSIQNTSQDIPLRCHINKTDLNEADSYTLIASASNSYAPAENNKSELEYDVVVDFTSPSNSNISTSADGLVFDTDTIRFRSGWFDKNDLETVVFNYTSGDGVWNSLDYGSDDAIDSFKPQDWEPEESRFEVVIEPPAFRSASTFNYSWIVIDRAGNRQDIFGTPVPVENRPPVFNTTSMTYTGLEGYDFNVDVPFHDDDVYSHDSRDDFVCELSNTSLFATSIFSDSSCRVWWNATGMPENGTYEFNITVSDVENDTILSSTEGDLNIEIFPTEYQNLTIDSSFGSEVDVTYRTGDLKFSSSKGQSSSSVSTLLKRGENYSVSLSSGRFRVFADNVSSADDDALFYFRSHNNASSIRFDDDELGSDLTYAPQMAYATSVNFSTVDRYTVSFNVSGTGIDPSRMVIFKYPDSPSGINFTNASNYGLLDTSVDGDIVSTVVSNFSAFILAENTTSVSKGDDSSSGSDSSSSSGSSSGSIGGNMGGVSTEPEPNCSDGIKNQDEIGIDCGGVCNVSCISGNDFDDDESEWDDAEPTCSDGILNQGEQGVDCGGPCPDCVVESCSDGILNQGEQGVDCGGPCPPCKEDSSKPEEPDMESPVSPFKMPSFLWISLSVIAVLGIVVFAFKTHRFSFRHEHVGPGQPVFNDEFLRVARFMAREMDETKHSLDEIRAHLLSHGVDSKYV